MRCTQPRYSEAEEGIAARFRFRDTEPLEISHSGVRALVDDWGEAVDSAGAVETLGARDGAERAYRDVLAAVSKALLTARLRRP